MTLPSATELFGTDEPAPLRRKMQAGEVSAILEDGNLRNIRFGETEVLRAINYLARDTGWGTYAAVISNLELEESPARFLITYDARCEGPEGQFDYRMTIIGSADGVVSMAASGFAVSDFPTNRTGFVLLHPADVAGLPLLIETGQEERQARQFPILIDPSAPATDIRAMSHAPLPGLLVRAAMTGDAFEMEDQRNWSDASFKTYVRPLSKPWPYVLAKGTRDTQSVTVTVSSFSPRSLTTTGKGDQRLRVGPIVGEMPQMALFADRPEALAGDPALMPKGLAQHLILRWVSGQGIGDIASGLSLARTIDAAPVIEAILPARDAAAEVDALLTALGGHLPMPNLLVAPHREFKSSPTASLPPGEVPVDDLVAALRSAGYVGRVLAGTPSHFAEFNRNPPGPLADGVYFGGCGIVHAADDVSVMETLSVYAAILPTASHLAADRPIWLGPCTLGARHSPYGASVVANPLNKRVSMAGLDPRHGALFGAAYAVGIAAACAGSGVECLTLAAPFGPFGVISAKGKPVPLMAVHIALAAAAGRQRRRVDCQGLALVAWENDDTINVLAANTGEIAVRPGLPKSARVRLLAEDATWQATPAATLRLDPYRTAWIVLSSE